jgi:hypothetical protein
MPPWQIEIALPASFDGNSIDTVIESAIAHLNLRVTLRGSLKKFPGCVHWHVKNGRETGTLEITLWPAKRRAWFTVQGGRRGAWIEEKMALLKKSIQRRSKAKWQT